MDSRDAPPPPGPPGMMVGPNPYSSAMANNHHHHHHPHHPHHPHHHPQHHHHHHHSNNNSPMIGSAQMMAGAGRFPFNSVSPPPQPPPPASKPPSSMDSLGPSASANPYDGSSPPMRPCASSGGGGGLSNDSGAKKKRGRPRKYSPDGGIMLGLAPTPMSSSGTGGGGGASHGDSGGNAPSSDPSSKKHRGRPPGSGKRQMDALGAGGIGFTPHVITVKAGEDVASKIMAFSQQGPRTVCILSASGAICDVPIRQPATSGGMVLYEGQYEIISLSGSLLSDSNGDRTRPGGLNVSIAGVDGQVLGGGVAGSLMAASPVQVIVGSFLVDGKKSGSSNTALKSASAGPQPQMLNFSGGHLASGSPQSQGESSESSEENGNSSLNRGPGFYNNANQHLHHSMAPAYNMWPGQAQQ